MLKIDSMKKSKHEWYNKVKVKCCPLEEGISGLFPQLCSNIINLVKNNFQDLRKLIENDLDGHKKE